MMKLLDPLRPYTMTEQPSSDGRAFLARAFTFFCVCEWGYSPEEIEAGLDASQVAPDDVRGRVLLAARELGNVFLRGDVETYARPFGGGTPIPLSKTTWELDDFTHRFATSAIDPKQPFDPSAACTHWLFVDAEQFDGILGLAGPSPRQEATQMQRRSQEEARVSDTILGAHDRFLRLPDIIALVGMSRSTIYERMKAGLFPNSIELGGNIVVWREAEVRDWMAEQQRRRAR